MERKSQWQVWLGLVVIATIVLSLWLVFSRPAPTPTPPATSGGSEIINATLREYDDKGKLIWEIEAEQGEYRQDRRIADIISVKGKFYESGEVVVIASGDTGVINQATQEIQIKGNVKGVIVKEKIDITANNLNWSAEQDQLTATGNISLSKPDDRLKITGGVLEGKPSRNRFTLKKNVIATAGKLGNQTSDTPLVEIKSETLNWDVKAQRIFTTSALTATQTTSQPDSPEAQGKRTLTAKRGEWNTKKQMVDLQGEVIAKDEKMDIEVKTDRLQWDLAEQKVTLPNPFAVSSPSRSLTITAQTGTALLEGEKINLQGSVQAQLRTDQATVNAERVEWQIPSQLVTADGGILYTRTANSLTVRGDRATADLANQTVQVTGSDVTSEFIP